MNKYNSDDFMVHFSDPSYSTNVNIFSLFGSFIYVLLFIIISFLVVYLAHQILIFHNQHNNEKKEILQEELNNYTKEQLKTMNFQRENEDNNKQQK